MSLYPDHASLPPDELRRRQWRDRLDQIDPDELGERAAALAHHEAEDAARAVLEAVPLREPLKMPMDVWEFWASTLGEYDFSLPTGVRVGKRWCRTYRGHTASEDRRWIMEYVDVGNGMARASGFAVEISR